ncbi:MAG: UrcA family protein [Terriglobales bacterium]
MSARNSRAALVRRLTATNGPSGNFSRSLSTIQETIMNTLTTRSSLHGLIAVAIFGVLASSFSAVSTADPSTVSVNVKFADLNLSSASGARVLYDRIRRAAQGGCSYYLFETDADEARCVHDAIANAVTKVNHPALFAVYDAKNKTPRATPLVSQSR